MELKSLPIRTLVNARTHKMLIIADLYSQVFNERKLEM